MNVSTSGLDFRTDKGGSTYRNAASSDVPYATSLSLSLSLFLFFNTAGVGRYTQLMLAGDVTRRARDVRAASSYATLQARAGAAACGTTPAQYMLAEFRKRALQSNPASV